MAKVITDGKTSIGAYEFSDRKKPSLCIQKGISVVVYGSFIDKERANEFMNEFAKFVGAKKEGTDNGI